MRTDRGLASGRKTDSVALENWEVRSPGPGSYRAPRTGFPLNYHNGSPEKGFEV